MEQKLKPILKDKIYTPSIHKERNKIKQYNWPSIIMYSCLTHLIKKKSHWWLANKANSTFCCLYKAHLKRVKILMKENM